MGVIRIAPLDTLRVFFGQGDARDQLVLFEFRLPRMVLSLLVGAGIAVSGAIFQSVSQNDLAEPGILGINAGASLAVVLFIFFFQGSAVDLSMAGTWSLPVSALAGAFLVAAAHLCAGLEKRRFTCPARFGRDRRQCGV